MLWRMRRGIAKMLAYATEIINNARRLRRPPTDGRRPISDCVALVQNVAEKSSAGSVTK